MNEKFSVNDFMVPLESLEQTLEMLEDFYLDERFEEVFRFDTARGTFKGGRSEKREKLFMVKEGNRLINDSNANFVKVKDAE